MSMAIALAWPRQLTYPIELWPTPARLARADQRELLFEAILEEGSVSDACEAVGMSRASVYRYSASDEEFERQFRKAREIAAEIAYDDCIKLADNMTTANDWGKTRLQIETRMRVAGKIISHLADKSVQVNNYNDNRKVLVVTDAKRRELQDRLQRLQLESK